MKNLKLKCASLGAVVVLLLAGCGSDSPAGADVEVAPQETSAGPAAPVQTEVTEATETGDNGADLSESEPAETAAESEVEPDDAEAGEPSTGDAAPSEPAAQADSCEWENAALAANGPSAPAGQEGDLHTVIVGAWQHTHFNTGAGFEAVENDIRYVFPAVNQLIYCQHVPGITDHAENRAEISWDGEQMVLPGSAPGYRVTEWSATTMVWVNLMDDSLYLLQRR